MRNRLLIADPDETLADIYRRFFEKRGFNVETASSGLACLNKLREHRPKLLVLDMELLWGGFDGVLARISCDPDLPFVPVVLLAGGVNGTGSRHSSDLVIERLRKPFRLG